ncbi:MAG: type II CRISPR RNA-guided endonuclease Cas9 [Rhodospirillales bacterium]|nr:type II CRISPR RNA-guided endonuclease Cas9 [Rhodospirillales bacterium]
MGYSLGIDIGIASVGFAGVDQDRRKILFSGVHIFEAAENPKDGSSLAAPRREKRGLRRVISRKSQRKKRIRSLLARYGLKDIENIDLSKKHPKTAKGCPPVTPWDLRKIAFERKLTDAEFSRVLFHIAKHRGFQSNKKSALAENDTEGKKVLSGAVELEEKWVRSGEKTVASYLSTQPKQRNGDGDYTNSIKRDFLREEVCKIFAAQKAFGNEKASEKLLLEYAGNGKLEERNTLEGDGIAFYQRPLQSSEHLVGECTFEKGEKRAPKCSYTAELFVLWGKLNNTRIKDVKGNERALTQDEKNKLVDLAHKNKGGVTYKQARKDLSLSEDERFNISYRKLKDEDNSWEKIRDNSEKSSFLSLQGYHALKEALDTGSAVDWQSWISNRREALDDIARVLSFYEDKKQVDNLLSVHNLTEDEKDRLCHIKNFKKSVDLSLKAIRNILPHMQEGLRYDESCKAAGYHHSKCDNKGSDTLPPFDDIRNPVVNRALSQTRKVINACIRKYGMPEKIIVELARNVGKSFKDRKDIEREQKKNEAYRGEARKHIAEILGIIEDNVSGEDILKYRLWKEQDGYCPYSGQYITPEMLRESTTTQIDHIIPYSRSWDNSYMNKVLCLTNENQKKANQTPYEYLSGTSRFEAFQAMVRQLPPKKTERLLMESYDDKEQSWKDRALNDTRYMARLLKNHIEQNLTLGDGQRVQTRNGALTANLRGAWGFPIKDRRNDRHHAIDAIVLACSTQSMVQKFANWNKYEARRKNPSERPLPPKPWDTFREDALNVVYGTKNKDGKREGGIFVSRMPVRTITGAAHQETIRSIRKSDGKVIQRVKLRSLTLPMLENLVDKDRNLKLYNVLKERLDTHGGKADKAFAEPVFMLVNDPSKPAPRINSVRIETTEKSGIEINEGLASNGDQVRVDVFQKDGKYYAIPIYAHHFVQDHLPNKAVIAYKEEHDWQEMDEKDFQFSLYKNDLVRIKSKTEDYLAYYMGTIDRSTGAISIRTHDNDPSFGKDGTTRTGVKTLLAFEKYSVNYFGDRHRIEKEIRRGVADCDDPESGGLVSGEGATEAAE